MLTEIYCKEFKDNGMTRPPIRFHRGLNVVLGSENATNSIGKSTALLAIDFAFGGSTYVKAGDIADHIGPHVIYFTFEFDNTTFRFSRHTGNPKVVCVCDDGYCAIESWEIKKFTSWLLERYDMTFLHGSFRDLTSGYFRIYGKDNYDETRPLKAFAHDSAEKGVKRLLKLFGEYGSINQLQKECDLAQEKKSAFASARKHAFVVPASSAAEKKRNQVEITELRQRLDELARQSSEGLANVDPIVADHVASVERDISSLRKQKDRLTAQLTAMRDDLSIEPYKGTNSFSRLQDYFPGVDVRELGEIELFHKKITNVLKGEHRNAERELQAKIEMLETKIHALEEELTDVRLTPSVSSAVLESYADLFHRIKQLESANECFEEQKALGDEVKRCNSALRKGTENILNSVENLINNELDSRNAQVCDSIKTAPRISIPDLKHYSFVMPNDMGTGSQTRGMFLLDYVLLDKSALPAFAHDTNTIKQIQDDVMINLLELYSTSGKQIFVALDKAESYSDGVLPRVVEENTVLRLGPGHELFGYSWNEVTGEDEQSSSR